MCVGACAHALSHFSPAGGRIALRPASVQQPAPGPWGGGLRARARARAVCAGWGDWDVEIARAGGMPGRWLTQGDVEGGEWIGGAAAVGGSMGCLSMSG